MWIELCGGLQEVDLLSSGGGNEEAVTIGNRSIYLRLLCHHLLTSAIEEQTAAVVRGLQSVIPAPIIMVSCVCGEGSTLIRRSSQAMRLCLSAEELDVVIAGNLCFDLDDWQQNTVYMDGYDSESPQVKWFWELLGEWEPSQHSKLLSFVTGCVAPLWCLEV